MQEELFGSELNLLRTEFRDHLTEGMVCKLCDRFGQLYKRSLLGVMAAGVVWLVRESGRRQRRWVHITEAPKWLLENGGVLQTTRHWDLVEQREENTKPHTRTSGMWRPTDEGVAFVDHGAKVPKYAFTYNTLCHGHEGPDIDVIQAMGNKFNYWELRFGERP